MFPIYKKELQSFFYTPFAYAISPLFMLLFSVSVFIYNVRKRIAASEVEIIGLLLNSG